MTSFTDLIPVISRQTRPVQELMDGLYQRFYAASLNGDRVVKGQPADVGHIREHALQSAPAAMAALQPRFAKAHLGEPEQQRALTAATEAINRVIDQRFPGGIPQIDDQEYKAETGAEVTFAVAHEFDWR